MDNHTDSPELALSSDDVTETVRLLSRIFCALAAIVGIPGNLAVICSIFTFREMRTISNIYIFNLALADLIFLLGTPIVVLQSVHRTWIFGTGMCKIFISSNGLSQFASALFIGILSFDRYLAVCRPVQATEWRTLRAATIISSFAWILVSFEMTPLFLSAKLINPMAPIGDDTTCMFFWGNEEYLKIPDNYSELHEEDPVFKLARAKQSVLQREIVFSNLFFITYTFTISYLLPLLAVWFFYANIIKKMWARRKHIWGRKKSMKRTTYRVSILGLAIVISYTILWLPFWVVQWSLVAEIFVFHWFEWRVRIYHIAFTLQYVNSAANPFLYVFMSDSFKRNVLKLIRSTSAYQYRKPRPTKDNGESMSFFRPANSEATTVQD